MAGSSPEDDTKPPARSDQWGRQLPRHQLNESKFDSGMNMTLDWQAGIANLMSLQSSAQHSFFNPSHRSQDNRASSYLSAPFESGLPNPASSAPQAQPPGQEYMAQQHELETLRERQRFLNEQLAYYQIPQRHPFLDTSHHMQPPHIGFSAGGLPQHLQSPSQLAMHNSVRELPLENQQIASGHNGSMINWGSMASVVPYSGAAAAAADIGPLPHSETETERSFAETFRTQTAHLQLQNFAGSASSAKSKIPSTKSKPKKPKDKDKPKRPLSGYNIFFQEQRALLLSELPNKTIPKRRNNKNPNRSEPHGKISFENMAKTIGAAWKKCPADCKDRYNELANQDKERYNVEKEVWQSQQSAEMTLQQKLLQQQVDSQTMREYISQHEAQTQPRSDGKRSRKSSTGSASSPTDNSWPSQDDGESEDERKPASS